MTDAAGQPHGLDLFGRDALVLGEPAAILILFQRVSGSSLVQGVRSEPVRPRHSDTR